MDKPTVAILGASADRTKYGNIAVRAHLQQGYTVFPINPKGGEIEGLPVLPNLAAIPVDTLDKISVYLPPAVLLAALPEIAKKPHEELWLNPGTESPAVLAAAHELGLSPILACSIVALGVRPSQFS